MAGKLPKDCSSRIICTRSRGIFAYQLDAEKWEWHEQTGTDHGTDVVLELSDDDSFCGKKIEGQIKGTKKTKKLKNGCVSFDLDVKTINYALGNANPFVLFLVDIDEEKVYFLSIQEYFISNPERVSDAKKNTSKLTLHINPCDNLKENGDNLVEISKCVYIVDSNDRVHKVKV